MNQNSKISWTQATWNPVTGCTKISQGCKYCYAEAQAVKLQSWNNPRYQNGFKVTLHNDLVDKAIHWRKPRLVFVNSMSDLFHEDVPLAFVKRVFKTMNDCPRHEFQILTKRADRLLRDAAELTWTDNIWMGVSVEDERVLSRIDILRKVPARVRFLSLEPLLGPFPHLDLDDIHWVIVGGESGADHRPMRIEWVRDIRNKCIAADVPFYFKQWDDRYQSTYPPKLDGRTWEEYPVRSTEIVSQDEPADLFSLVEPE